MDKQEKDWGRLKEMSVDMDERLCGYHERFFIVKSVTIFYRRRASPAKGFQ
jgi:hypothetical protein